MKNLKKKLKIQGAMVMDKSEIIELLNAGEVNIVFVKASNGELRKMRATRSTDIIPLENQPAESEDESSVLESASCTVWDIEANDWRAFRWNLLEMVNGVGV